MITNRILLSSLSALALSGCAAGPDYVTPHSSPPTASGPFISADDPAFAAAPLPAHWWRLYDDPVLDGLVEEALAANTDIRQALARIDRARAGLRGANAGRLPQTGISAGSNYGRVPETQVAPGADRDGWTHDAGLSVAYEVDLFGRVGRGIEAARADLAASQADADAVRVIVVAETTRAYADAASGAARLRVAEDIVALLDRSLALTERRHDAGLSSGLDVARVAALRDQRAAEIPSLQAGRNAALFRLATLTGRAPSELPAIAGERSIALEVEQAIPVGDGAQLLARRPDIRAAERQLAANTARIGVATADLYPRITLGASIGATGPSLGDLFTGGPLRWLAGSLIDWAFPNQEPARARIAAAEAETQQALAAFDGTVLSALGETETALSNYSNALERRRVLSSAREQAERAARITRAQQREGAINSLEQLDAERTLAEATAQLAAQDAAVSSAQIDLFRALGGGWENS
ncbi:efflux transporter outer membrane subunit [Alteraurantiacibacter aquimixticola]|uniref:Efflux transporter outer membrane subunit n=1 Tax=Alteraurantiacibacter aquimixticola TaxID=2489173 RepID=A0A4T3F123_9SPHN|nr:efflux transporter outer membrane subunit [Alteraurantiacibacter aquimixticola]TIX50742.1 efflux transporter outer membrane subunit [Alteraurantiacibacter aquimixticola]